MSENENRWLVNRPPHLALQALLLVKVCGGTEVSIIHALFPKSGVKLIFASGWP
jgi:hypothetical protein